PHRRDPLRVPTRGCSRQSGRTPPASRYSRLRPATCRKFPSPRTFRDYRVPRGLDAAHAAWQHPNRYHPYRFTRELWIEFSTPTDRPRCASTRAWSFSPGEQRDNAFISRIPFEARRAKPPGFVLLDSKNERNGDERICI